MSGQILIPVAVAELVDKLTILEIKRERIKDEKKTKNIEAELTLLQEVFSREVVESAELRALRKELREINMTLWDIEDDIRDCERAGDFSDRFVQLARSVYRSNDARSEKKRQINLLVGSEIVEEKSYALY